MRAGVRLGKSTDARMVPADGREGNEVIEAGVCALVAQVVVGVDVQGA